MKRIMCTVCVVFSLLCWTGCQDGNQALYDYNSQRHEKTKSNLNLLDNAQQKTSEFLDLLDNYHNGG